MVDIVFALGFVDVPDVEVAGIGVCDVESGDRGIGHHGAVFGEGYSDTREV